MMAFVAPVDVVPSLPPPPPQRVTPPESRPVSTAANAAPIEAPSTIALEHGFEGPAAGVEGGVEGGIAGGVVGGIVGGIPYDVSPLPPPPPARRTPIRVGGQITPPKVLVRIPAIYPEIAAHAQIQGVVILEATVDEEGVVQDVKVLRSVRFLDGSAIEALKQWRYEPLLLNGEPSPFVLTVSMVFSVESRGER
jgi:protein TonB